MKRSKPKTCRSCRDFSRELKKAREQLAAAVSESTGFDRSRNGELTFYRGLLKDLVDDYLIRRNPFVVEPKP